MTQVQDIKPTYEVHPFNGTTTRNVCTIDEKTRQVVCKDEPDSGGYIVYFPKGHSIRVRDDEELAVLGFDKPAKLIDMETGDETGTVPENLKVRSTRMTRRTKSGENATEKGGAA